MYKTAEYCKTVEMVGHTCANLDATNELIAEIDKRKDEYTRNTGEQVDDAVLVRVLWEGLDEKTMDEADAQGIDNTDTTYTMLCKFLENIAQHTLVRSNLRRTFGKKGFGGAAPMELGLIGDGKGVGGGGVEM